MSVGLDIGSKTIKIIELSKEGSGWSLSGSGVVGYSGNAPDHLGLEREMVPLADVIRKLHAEAKISSKDIAVSLPEPLVFTRVIKFPLLTDQEIASAVKWEAEQYIPIPVNEAIVQYQILERKESASPPVVSVLLIAAPRNIAEKYVKLISMAGLNVVAVETELMSLVRALAPEGKTALLVDFGAKSTDIAIAKNGMLSFSRSIPIAGEAFTRAIAQGLGIEPTQAEEYKKAYGLSGSMLEGKIRSALDPIFRIVADEIKKAIHFYQSEDKEESPTSVILSGGSSGMPEVISFLSKLVNIEVMPGNPFSKIRLDSEAAKTLAPYAPLYSIAVGLAERGE